MRDANSPYSCWLRFTALIQNDTITDDTILAKCANRWHAAAPNHPLAAALYGWTLIDKSIRQISETSRKAVIRNAIDTLENAESINPNSTFLEIALMRAYAANGNGKAVRLTARKALKLWPENLDVEGMSGMMLVLWNDPRGEALVKDAVARHFNPPPWYFIGLYVPAMMRNDTGAAHEALEAIRSLDHSLAVLPVLSAAYEAQTGQIEQARKSWKAAKQRQPILKFKPELYFQRLPVSPEAKQRLKKWLAPVLD